MSRVATFALSAVPPMFLTKLSVNSFSTCTMTFSSWPEIRLAASKRPGTMRPSMWSPLPMYSVASPGTTSAIVPPSSPPDLSSTWESFGTLYSPSSSRRISTLSLAILNRCTRPMFTPRICTGSPRRMPPASVTTVLTM